MMWCLFSTHAQSQSPALEYYVELLSWKETWGNLLDWTLGTAGHPSRPETGGKITPWPENKKTIESREYLTSCQIIFLHVIMWWRKSPYLTRWSCLSSPRMSCTDLLWMCCQTILSSSGWWRLVNWEKGKDDCCSKFRITIEDLLSSLNNVSSVTRLTSHIFAQKLKLNSSLILGSDLQLT